MIGSLPFDLTEIVAAELAEGRRENDHLLHASSHLVGSLRHAQLDVVEAPRIESALVSAIRMETGTMWHRKIQEALVRAGVPFMQEVNLTPWMPKGWSGTADLLVWVPGGGKEGRGGFVLRDIKTTKGESIQYRLREGASEEHIWQVSAYYHGCVRMGLPMIRECGIYYLPMNDVMRSEQTIMPVEVIFEPLEWPVVRQQMEFRNKRAEEYKTSLGKQALPPTESGKISWALPLYLTDALEPVQERVLKPTFSRRDDKWELKLMPHWSAMFCPFDDILCDCNTQGVTKVGEWASNGTYIPRAGFDVRPPAYPGGS